MIRLDIARFERNDPTILDTRRPDGRLMNTLRVAESIRARLQPYDQTDVRADLSGRDLGFCPTRETA